MAEDGLRQFFKISCPCGTALRLDPLKADRRQRCPKCSLLLDFVVTLDGRSRRPRVSIVVSPEAMNLVGESLGVKHQAPEPEPEPERKPPPRTRVGGKSFKGVLGTCTCGTSFPVDDQELTSIKACPRCGVEYHVVVKIERGTKKKTAILVPVKSEPVRRPSIAPLTRTPRPKARTQAPPGVQRVICGCGEGLDVRKKDVAKGMDCPRCARPLKFQEVPDPQTLVPVIRIRPEPKK